MRFPAVRAKIPEVIAASSFERLVAELQRVLDAREELGFIILDRSGLTQLVAAKQEQDPEQTEYIPPRIWTYQVERLRECLSDYAAHREKVEECFQFCVQAYAKNYGTLRAALTSKSSSARGPFQNRGGRAGVKSGCEFHGAFFHTAAKFGIVDLLRRWVGEPVEGNRRKGISLFSAYLSLVQHAGLAYVLNFSLMRYEEGRGLRADCLSHEEDEVLGKIPILCGATTKTDPDSDARWPTTPSIEVAIGAVTSVSRLRMRCAEENPFANPSAEDITNPYLFHRSFEPWVARKALKPYSIMPSSMSYRDFIADFPRLFEPASLVITEEDLRIARSVTATLNSEMFQVGKIWPLAWHQLRRTGAVNMQASGIVSDSTVQFLMKHLTRAQSLYYGRGSSKLSYNDEVRTLLVNAQYEVMGRELADIFSDRFVSPHGDDYKKKMVLDSVGLQDVSILSQEDAKHFEAAARKGTIFYRTTPLGGCMSNGQCDGDCIESIADCAGGDGGPFCKHVLFDRERAKQNANRLEHITLLITSTPLGAPRLRALEQEKRGLENYFAFINKG
ncbi:hypothetical protein LPW11_09910 [Geomonas sp. RF6]|uniref:hypothetical protein n=1 Tax=Geomonas sp. RF6 TaxID=2897342 RepID=UPI001E306430|nr:hypothetical protein [Geomonas sp. RF6]UFS72489.1 hypothetical protein LPW11_09910 [Geomonas sp. RF6]